MENILFYKVMPSLDQLREDFSKFIQLNTQFQGMIKIGKTTKKRLRTRYPNCNKYGMLTEKNIFCLCATENLALTIERLCQDIWLCTGKLIPGSDSKGGINSEIEHDLGIVYVTKERP